MLVRDVPEKGDIGGGDETERVETVLVQAFTQAGMVSLTCNRLASRDAVARAS